LDKLIASLKEKHMKEGGFSEKFFKDIREPKTISEINGRIRIALCHMAKKHFGDNIPEVLKERPKDKDNVIPMPATEIAS